jgi:hypothetical protein
MNRRLLVLLSLPLLCSWGCGRTSPQGEVAAVGLKLGESVPASIPLALETAPPVGGAAGLLAGKTQGGERVLLQAAPALFASPGDRMIDSFCAVVPAGTPAGLLPLKRVEGDGPPSPFTFQEEQGRLTLLEGGVPALTYNFGIQDDPEAPVDRRRSTYVHPLFDLTGTPLTDDFPTDHFHHRGLSWMWPRVTVSGETYDLWHIQGLYQRFENWLEREAGPVCATVGVENSWRLEDRRVAQEWVWIRAFQGDPRGRVIDLSLTWKALEPISLLGAETRGYGGLCLRLAPRTEAVITVPTGVLEEDSDLQPYPWADQSGLFEGASEISGVSVFQHRDNPGFPAGWCLRHYGFLGVSWPGLEPFELGVSETLTLRFRIWVHQGSASEAQVADFFSSFSGRPAAKVVSGEGN